MDVQGQPPESPFEPVTGETQLKEKLKEGLGEAGRSIQGPDAYLTDREVVRKTLLRPVVRFQELSFPLLADNVDGGKKCKKAALTKQTWEKVMEEAFKQFPAGSL